MGYSVRDFNPLLQIDKTHQKEKPGWLARFLMASSWMQLHRSAARTGAEAVYGWVRAIPVPRLVLPQANPQTVSPKIIRFRSKISGVGTRHFRTCKRHARENLSLYVNKI